MLHHFHLLTLLKGIVWPGHGSELNCKILSACKYISTAYHSRDGKIVEICRIQIRYMPCSQSLCTFKQEKPMRCLSQWKIIYELTGNVSVYLSPKSSYAPGQSYCTEETYYSGSTKNIVEWAGLLGDVSKCQGQRAGIRWHEQVLGTKSRWWAKYKQPTWAAGRERVLRVPKGRMGQNTYRLFIAFHFEGA